jgi:hypothetical protein
LTIENLLYLDSCGEGLAREDKRIFKKILAEEQKTLKSLGFKED